MAASPARAKRWPLVRLAALVLASAPAGGPRLAGAVTRGSPCRGMADRMPAQPASNVSAAWEAPPGAAWRAPIVGTTLEAVYARAHYRRIVHVDPRAAESCSSASAPDILAELGRNASTRTGAWHVAVAIDSHSMNSPLMYGHVWDYVNAYYCALVRPRAREHRRAPAPHAPVARVLLPAGPQKGGRALAELQQLFSSPLELGLQATRRPWVPMCVATCCVQHGGVPLALRGRVDLLVLHVADRLPLPPRVSRAFSADVRAAILGAPRGAGGARARPDLVLLVHTTNASNGRRIHREPELAAALRAWAAESGLGFAHDPGVRADYAEEVRLFSRAAVLVSVFGSALHNCRYMRPGAVVLELHGALKDDFGGGWQYYQLCALGHGLRHVPLPVPGALPRFDEAKAARGDKRPWSYDAPDARRHKWLARVQPGAVVHALRRALPAGRGSARRGEWALLLDEYATALRERPDPRALQSDPRLLETWRRPKDASVPHDPDGVPSHYRACSALDDCEQTRTREASSSLTTTT